MRGSCKEYAVAMFALGVESDICGELNEGLALMHEVFEQTPEMYAYLDSPGIPLSERLGTIHAAFDESVPEYAVSMLCLICEHGDIEVFPDIASEYEKLYKASLQVSRAYITSAVELTEDEKERLRKQLAKKANRKIEMYFEINPKLLGGLIVEMDGTIIDGSLRRRLKNLKEVMDE